MYKKAVVILLNDDKLQSHEEILWVWGLVRLKKKPAYGSSSFSIFSKSHFYLTDKETQLENEMQTWLLQYFESLCPNTKSGERLGSWRTEPLT